MTNKEITPAPKPCPLCGGEGFLEYDAGNEVWSQSWQCGCKKCGIITSKAWGSSTWFVKKGEDAAAKTKAINSWNSRTESDLLKQAMDALETIMGLDIKGHSLMSRLQFSTPGREILEKVCDVLAQRKDA